MKKLMVIAVFGLVLLGTSAAFAEGAEGAGKFLDYGLIAAGLGMALASFGGALSQGKVAAAAVEGIARNPGASGNMFLSFILGLALIESLVIYSLIIEILIVYKM